MFCEITIYPGNVSGSMNIKYVVPVMIGDDCCESSDTDAVTYQVNLLTQEEP